MSDERPPTYSGNNIATVSVVLLLSLIAMGGAFVLGLYALTPAAGRQGLLDDMRPYLIAAIAGTPGIVSAILASGVHKETKGQSQRLATIERQTNGELKQAVGEVVGQVVEETFDKKLASRRSTDPEPTRDRRTPAKTTTTKGKR